MVGRLRLFVGLLELLVLRGDFCMPRESLGNHLLELLVPGDEYWRHPEWCRLSAQVGSEWRLWCRLVAIRQLIPQLSTSL